MRGPSLFNARTSLVLPRRSPRLDSLVAEQPCHLALDLLLGDDPSLVSAKLDAGAPHVAHVALVGELVSEVRPAEERHAVQHAFHGRVPPAV